MLRVIAETNVAWRRTTRRRIWAKTRDASRKGRHLIIIISPKTKVAPQLTLGAPNYLLHQL